MRKTSEEITREVFGQGSRWIGWNNWLKHQVIFKHILKKVEEGKVIRSRRSFYLRCQSGGWAEAEMIKANIDPSSGDLVSVEIPSYDTTDRLIVTRNQSCFVEDKTKQTSFGEMFEDPWRPTYEELDLFQVLYGEEQALIEMNKAFFGVIKKFDRAVNNLSIQIVYPS